MQGWTLHRWRHSALTHDAEFGASTPMLLARSRPISVRSPSGTRLGVDAVARHVVSRDPAALVVDHVLPLWQPRAAEVRGEAITLDTGGKVIMEGFDDPIIRIRPRRIVSWGLEDGFQARSVG